MDEESANWCRLAQTINLKGGEVLRRFLLLEILTSVCTKYSQFWTNNVDNPNGCNYLLIVFRSLNWTFEKSQNSKERILRDLLKSWRPFYSEAKTIKWQLSKLNQWKNDINQKRCASVSVRVNDTLTSWLSQIRKEIKRLKLICNFICSCNDTFHYHLQNVQSGLLLEIEKNDEFLSRCTHKLRSVFKPSSSAFQQLIHVFKQELNIWKQNCCKVLQGFCIECREMITLWLEDQNIRNTYGMLDFLHRFKKEIEECNVQSDVDVLFDKWDIDLHNVFDRYENQIQEADSTEAISELAQYLCRELEQFHSLKDKKIRDFFCLLTSRKSLLHPHISKLKDISTSSDLNKLDLAFLIYVWRNGKFVHSQLKYLNEAPYDWDTSVSADILRLKQHKNDIVAHMAQPRISSDYFEKLWKEVTLLLRNIASRCGDKFSMKISLEIDKMKDYPLEPHRQSELPRELLTWCQEDIIAQPSARSDAVHQSLDQLQSFQTAEENLSISRQDHIIPMEIRRMDEKSIQLYKDALRDGNVKVYNIRVMVVGPCGVGKTTLTRRLLGQQMDLSERKSTDGIDVYKHCCKISLDTGEWIIQQKGNFSQPRLNMGKCSDTDQLARLCCLMKLLTDRGHSTTVSSEKKEHIEVIYQRVTIPKDIICNPIQDDDNILSSSESDSVKEVNSISKGPENVFPVMARQIDVETNRVTIQQRLHRTSNIEETDPVMELLHLLSENVDKLKSNIGEYAALAMWDFAGQYTFYTTHQTFLTCRAIYLLVTNLEQHVTNPVKDDDFYFDSQGERLCHVQDLVEVWLNSVHSCAPSPAGYTPVTSAAGITVTSPAAGIAVTSPDDDIPATPPVILVGTHVDKIPEDNRQEFINKYFQQICLILNEKPTLKHLADFEAIDNTQIDPKLETLKKKIFQLASKQPYWGEEVPANWLPLEERLMKIKASGIKVIQLSLVNEINQRGSVGIMTAEQLDLFLRFEHDTGNILYFSVEGLRERIVLDPQWLIDAMKSLITAEMFILKNKPSTRDKWFKFRENGELTSELIDAIWTKQHNPEFHENKKHILLLMEKMNILARPKSYIEGGEEVKEENYFLAPCMLREKTPRDVVCPKPHPHMKSSTVLCYVFTGRFLPSPIFHRLIAACLSYWPIATKKTEKTQKNMIYCGCCVFQLDLYCKLTLHFREHVIYVRVTRMGIKKKTPSSKMCTEVREFITATLKKIIGYLGQSLKFEYFIQCPKYNGDSVNSLIPVSRLKENAEVPCDFHNDVIESHKLLKFWFKDQEQSTEDDAGKKQGAAKPTEEDKPQDPLVDKSLGLGRTPPKGTPGSMNTGREADKYIEVKRKHNQLCLRLNEDISKDSFTNMKRMAQTYLGRNTVAKAQNINKLLSYLEDKGVIGVGNYDKLIDIMRDAGVGIGMDEIQKTAKDIREIQNCIASQEQSETSSLDAHSSNQDSVYPSSAKKKKLVSESCNDSSSESESESVSFSDPVSGSEDEVSSRKRKKKEKRKKARNKRQKLEKKQKKRKYLRDCKHPSS